MYFVMRYHHLFRMIVGIFYMFGSEHIEYVSGMPLDLSAAGGSNDCDLNFKRPPGVQEGSAVAYEILFRDRTSLAVNSSDCTLEIWTDDTKISSKAWSKLRLSRRPRKLEVRMENENPELYKIYVDKDNQASFPLRLHFIMKVFCRKWKFSDCIHSLHGRGASYIQRRLMSVDQLYMFTDPRDDISFQPIILLLAGLMILVIAGSLCTGCAKDTVSDSIAEISPQLMSFQERSSLHHKLVSEEQSVKEEIVVDKDNVVETAEKMEGDSGDGNLTHFSVYDEPTVSVKPVTAESMHNLAPDSREEHVPQGVVHAQDVPISEKPKYLDNATEGDQKSGKKKHGNKQDHEHEEHKGKFWKRNRSSKTEHRTSEAGIKDEEHKHHDRRSRKESKEPKAKLPKSKDRKSSTDSDENKFLHEDHHEKPREAISTLERYSRELPPPPPPALLHSTIHSLPVRPVSQRQHSDPGTTGTEDDNYEIVERRRSKSDVTLEVTADDDYDTVRVEVEKRRLPVSIYDPANVEESWICKESDIYEIVEDTNPSVDELYSEVCNTNEKKRSALCDDEEEDEEDVDEDVEDPYSKIKETGEKEPLENAELYEEVDDRHGNGGTNGLLIYLEDAVDIRNRSKSDTFGLKKPRNDIIRRSNTIDVVRSRLSKVAPSVEELYAKVDLSKKTKRGPSVEEDSTKEQWSDDNPPPLPPVYVSSKQMQIEMGQRNGNADGLYDEVQLSTLEEQRPRNMELSVSDHVELSVLDEPKRLSAVSADHYELVEVKHYVATVEDDYAGLVNEGPRPKTDKCGGVESRHVENPSAPVNSSNGAKEDDSDLDEPHYELVTPRKTDDQSLKVSNAYWV